MGKKDGKRQLSKAEESERISMSGRKEVKGMRGTAKVSKPILRGESRMLQTLN